MSSTDDIKKEATEKRRAYAKPNLVDYGNVRDLTRGAGTTALDFHQTTGTLP